MSAPKWAKGMRRLAVGVYVDADHALHLDEAALCQALCVPYTLDNAEIVKRLALAAIREMWGVAPPCEVVHEYEDERPCN